MNKDQLRKLNGKLVKLRPLARRIDRAGLLLEPIEDLWAVSLQEDGLFISISRTGHGIRLPYDHIREYTSDPSGESNGFLQLKSQLCLSGDQAKLEPLGSARK